MVAELDRAREYHRRHAWADACDAFHAVDRVAPLATPDLGRLAESAHVLGRVDDAIELLQRLYQAHVDAGDTGPALRAAFYLSHALLMKGDIARAGGWIARAGRLAQSRPDCPESGFLLVPEIERQIGGGDFDGASATAARMAALARRLPDHDLAAVALHFEGRIGIRQGRVVDGLALLDEALVEVTTGPTSPAITSWIYCSVIDACRELQELRRAREWTVALNAWCDARPQYTGVLSAICRIHRSELLLLDGAWPDAVREAELACGQLGGGYGDAAAGPAFYQLAEAYRLRGDSTAAEEAYRNASGYGGQMQPGMALLWLARGRVEPAAAAVRRALAETVHPLARARLLPAHVEIMLAVPEVTAARTAVAELHDIAKAYGTEALRARSAYALGAVELAEGAPAVALAALRQAEMLWRDTDVPYEAARTRVLIALACHALGDDGSAALEFEAARQVFTRLGAIADLARLDALGNQTDAAGLSPRELEVLRLVAAGRSNQAIAAELTISDRTVERHISNIFVKLGVGSRTAAAAYAYEHGIQ